MKKIAKAVFVVAVVIGLTGMFSGTARADNDGWRQHKRYGHQMRMRHIYRQRAHWREMHEDEDSRVVERFVTQPYYYYDGYGRLRVTYRRVPVFVRQPAETGFNIVIPLDIR